MIPLLSIATLDKLRRTMYGTVSPALVLYKVTPTEGEIEDVRCTAGFYYQRMSDSHDLYLWLSVDAGISADYLHNGAVIGLEQSGVNARYVVKELKPFQQIGTGYKIRLTPEQGATA